MDTKRLFDIAGSTVGLVLTAPLMAGTAIGVRVVLGSPILFRQQRPGYRGKSFTMYKFRTMTDERGPDGEFLPDDERLGTFGQLLRSTSLDELPELFNVLKGDMSLVGPRPLLMKYLPLYSEKQKRRHDVRPGITGWAQINGRNDVSWQKRFADDLWYVDNQNLLLDIEILINTVMKVLSRSDIGHGDEVTIPNFRGNDEQGVPL